MNLFRKLYEKTVPLGIPLAWLQLSGERKRFFAALMGITFAVAMMLFQMGLHGALFRQVVAPIQLLNADLFVVGNNYEYFGVGNGFPEIRLHQAAALDEFDYATELKLATMSFKNADTGINRYIFVIAFDPTKKVFLTEDISEASEQLKHTGTLLFDKLSSVHQYGNVAEAFEKSNGKLSTELGGKHATIEKLIEIGTTFAAQGNVVTSIRSFNSIWQTSAQNTLNVGLIKLKPSENKKYDLNAIAEKLDKILPRDVVVMSKEQFIEREKKYWAENTPIGFVIGASMAVAIFVGAIIVYQILYTDVSDHLPEYATLKAIGFDDKFFMNIILQESIILSVLGFIPGILIATILYYVTRELVGMPAYLTFVNVAICFGLTIFMCAVAGLLATRKLRAANPADIF